MDVDYYVVNRPWGFMETVKVGDIGPKDEVLFKGTNKQCNNFIHSI